MKLKGQPFCEKCGEKWQNLSDVLDFVIYVD